MVAEVGLVTYAKLFVGLNPNKLEIFVYSWLFSYVIFDSKFGDLLLKLI